MQVQYVDSWIQESNYVDIRIWAFKFVDSWIQEYNYVDIRICLRVSGSCSFQKELLYDVFAFTMT